VADHEYSSGIEAEPDFFKKIIRIFSMRRRRKAVQDALDAVDAYMAERAPALFSLVIEHLRMSAARSSRTSTITSPPLQRQRRRHCATIWRISR
jgi:hypothetical protein